jgi:hypothetical protein
MPLRIFRRSFGACPCKAEKISCLRIPSEKEYKAWRKEKAGLATRTTVDMVTLGVCTFGTLWIEVPEITVATAVASLFVLSPRMIERGFIEHYEMKLKRKMDIETQVESSAVKLVCEDEVMLMAARKEEQKQQERSNKLFQQDG